jgi:p-aminobenzoyl-glutamate transporter AbgT
LAFLQKLLDTVGWVGNKVPYPAIILSGLIIILSHIFHLLGVTVTCQAIDPVTHQAGDEMAGVNPRRSPVLVISRFLAHFNYSNLATVGDASDRYGPAFEYGPAFIADRLRGRQSTCRRH